MCGSGCECSVCLKLMHNVYIDILGEVQGVAKLCCEMAVMKSWIRMSCVGHKVLRVQANDAYY
jgi:hypothetical protein